MTEETANKSIAKNIVLTIWTVFLWIFRSPSLLLLIVGAGMGYGMGFKLGMAKLQPQVAHAEQALLEFRTEIAQTIARSKEQEIKILNAIRARFYEQQTELEITRNHLRNARNNVRLCESTSTLSIPSPATGTNEASESGQPRPADEVLSDLAAEIASNCDSELSRFNLLQDWINSISPKTN